MIKLDNIALSLSIVALVSFIILVVLTINWHIMVKETYDVGEGKRKACDGSAILKDTGNFGVSNNGKIHQALSVIATLHITTIFLIVLAYIVFLTTKGYKELGIGLGMLALVMGLHYSYYSLLWQSIYKNSNSKSYIHKNNIKPPNFLVNVLSIIAVLLYILYKVNVGSQFDAIFLVLMVCVLVYVSVVYPNIGNVVNATVEYNTNAEVLNTALKKITSPAFMEYILINRNEPNKHSQQFKDIEDLYSYILSSTRVIDGNENDIKSIKDLFQELPLSDRAAVDAFYKLQSSKIGEYAHSNYTTTYILSITLITLLLFFPFHNMYIVNRKATTLAAVFILITALSASGVQYAFHNLSNN